MLTHLTFSYNTATVASGFSSRGISLRYRQQVPTATVIHCLTALKRDSDSYATNDKPLQASHNSIGDNAVQYISMQHIIHSYIVFNVLIMIMLQYLSKSLMVCSCCNYITLTQKLLTEIPNYIPELPDQTEVFPRLQTAEPVFTPERTPTAVHEHQDQTQEYQKLQNVDLPPLQSVENTDETQLNAVVNMEYSDSYQFFTTAFYDDNFMF
ncbi:Hypothetical_protein [Hexamita inflata]|uniref:Hypothetical_protein n=1 Tax=Hexamita inflata TaxID=28002 RepID=A0AA86TTV3_9EUKA|nr:Hypothetical protein HINF_LOCUS9528 [Hexamita inflata]